MNEEDTIAAICSGVGSSVTVIRISGKMALEIGNKAWKSKRKKLCLENRRILMLGRIYPNDDPVGESVLAVYMPCPRSYTGEDIVEIHAHGGSFNARRVLEEVIKCGARQAGPGEFTFRAFINGKLDLTQAEAVSDLITANSNMEVHLAERQMDGILGRKITEIRNELIEMLAECESRLDFPEEELDFIPIKEHLKQLANIKLEIEKLYSTRKEGAVLRDGIRVVIAGRPNAGKSSLLNLLLGYDRAITTSIPGTTRDTLEEFANVRGIPVKLIDTAGIRKSDNLIEEIGIKRSLSSLKRSQVTVWLLDALCDDLEKERREMEKHLKNAKNVIAVWNKIDQVTNPENLPSTQFPTVKISVTEKTGIDSFLNIFEKLVWEHPHATEPEIAVSARHAELLAQSLELIPDIIDTLSDEDWELSAISLRTTVSALGNIIGEEADLDIYETIFSKFCIGK
jgi:tRNA modification GTPase